MKLSANRIESLKLILKEIGLDYSDEQIHEAGLAIMRFVLTKHQRAAEIINVIGEKQNE